MDLGATWAALGLFWRDGRIDITLDINRAHEKSLCRLLIFMVS